MAENELNKFQEGESGFTEVEHTAKQESEDISATETSAEAGEVVDTEQLVPEEVINEVSEETTFIDHQHLGLSAEHVKNMNDANEPIPGSEEDEHDKKAEADLFEHGAANPRDVLENLLR